MTAMDFCVRCYGCEEYLDEEGNGTGIYVDLSEHRELIGLYSMEQVEEACKKHKTSCAGCSGVFEVKGEWVIEVKE